MPQPERPDAERITEALIAELSKPADGRRRVFLEREAVVAAVDELLDAGVIHVGPEAAAAAVVSQPLTGRELAARAAATLDKAREIGETRFEGHAPVVTALAAVAGGYRDLAATVATNRALQPDTEGTN